MRKLLVADDARDVAEVIAFGARMTWQDCQIAIAASGDEALHLFEEILPDLVVLDVAMPAPDGFEVCRRIRAASSVPILMLTVRDSIIDKVRALDLGADDYLTKPFDHLELLARLRALARRAGRTKEGSIATNTGKQSGPLGQADPSATLLSKRETTVLQMVADGCSNRQIAESLIIGERTVKFHVTSALNKLGADNRAHAAARAVRLGLV